MPINIITNGDFTSGITEWDGTAYVYSSVSADCYVSSPYSLKENIPGSQFIELYRRFSIPTGHKVYTRTMLNITTLNSNETSHTYLQVADYNDSVALGNVYDKWVITSGWELYGLIVTSTNGGIRFNIYTWTNSSGAAVYYLDNLVVVDLTAEYGAGLEPTVEWCNANIRFDFDLPGPSLTNLITNGIFTNTWVDCGWNTGGFTEFLSIDTQNYISSPSSLLFDVTTAGYYQMLRKVSAPTGHKLYVGAYINIISINSNIYLQITDYNDSHQLARVYDKTTVTSGWEHHGVIVISENGGFQLNIYNKSGTVKYYLDDLVCLDLTEVYGEGSEPTVEWCNTNIILPFVVITKTGTVSVTNGIQQTLTNKKDVNTIEILSLGAQQSLTYLCIKKSSLSIQNGIITGLSGEKRIYKSTSLTLGINLTLSNKKSSKGTIISSNGIILALIKKKVSYETISISQGIQQSLKTENLINVYITIGISQELSYCRSYISYKCLNAYKNSGIVLTGALNKAIIFLAYTKNYSESVILKTSYRS